MISGDDTGDWLYFFNHACEEGDNTMRTHYKNPPIHKAFNILETLSADDEVRRLAEIRERALKNEISELAAAKREGKEEGREEGVRSTAKNLLKMGALTLDQIAEATGLSEKNIAEIQKNL
ncbi:MAG: Rpn family recombination-promoting nuclease/putative transposase [Desulfobacteraceae bacterium]|nr:Rpn family recombination-promoting nuclease/putative transposase [Desulfobacteraceae bacterium]